MSKYKALLLRFETFLAIVAVLMFVVFAVVAPDFMKPETQLSLSSHMWEMGLLALMMTLIIVSGGIDLSVGSTMALAAVVLGLLHEVKVPMAGAVAGALITGLAAGFFNGVFIASVRVHPLIVTLASLAAYRGIAVGISNGRPMSGYPDAFLAFGSGTILGFPTAGVIFIVLFLIILFVMAKTKYGVWVHAVGYNETASKFSGITVERLKLFLYTAMGAFASLAAVMYVARRNTAKADIGDGLELEAITAVVLGGTSINGGKGSIAGTLIGIVVIHELREFLSWQFNRNELNYIVTGAILIVLVLVNRIASGKKDGKTEA
ncbi:MAG: ABC transporter permease [Spirochaetes bacterium]|nr:ABC transporter permease [Spirochaetota bacterium]